MTETQHNHYHQHSGGPTTWLSTLVKVALVLWTAWVFLIGGWILLAAIIETVPWLIPLGIVSALGLFVLYMTSRPSNTP
jgi:hypothetical protein